MRNNDLFDDVKLFKPTNKEFKMWMKYPVGNYTEKIYNTMVPYPEKSRIMFID